MLLIERVPSYLKSAQGYCMKSCFLKILGIWLLCWAKGSVGNWGTAAVKVSGWDSGLGWGPHRSGNQKHIHQRCDPDPPRLAPWPWVEKAKDRDRRKGVERGCPGKVAKYFPPIFPAEGQLELPFRQCCPRQMEIFPPLPDALLGVKINIIFFRKEIIISLNSKIEVKAPAI